MGPSRRVRVWVCGALTLIALAAPRIAAAQLVYGLTSDERLVVFAPSAPTATLKSMPITGVPESETLAAIDFRPRDGQLYALGLSGGLYRIHAITGEATRIGREPLAIALDGAPGMDFDPVRDQIRIVTAIGQNFRIDPDTSTVIDGDPAMAGVQGDTTFPGTLIVATAYSDNFTGTGVTTLYGINAENDRLVRIGGQFGVPSPNGGSVTPINPLGVDVGLLTGLDYAVHPDQLYLSRELANGSTQFLTVDVTTGAATPVGTIATPNNTKVIDIAVFSRQVMLHVLATNGHLQRINSVRPHIILDDDLITGLVEAPTVEHLVGIDILPQTGVLYGISNRSRLYTIDPDTGAALIVRPNVTFATIDGDAAVGYEADPLDLAGRSRVVTANGTHVTVDRGTSLSTDQGDIADGIVAIAATNDLVGAPVSTLYGINAITLQMVRIGGPGGNPSPDTGLATAIGPIGFDAGIETGFDITSATQVAFAATTKSNLDNQLFTIDLVTGLGRLAGPMQTAGRIAGLAAAQPGRVHFALQSVSVQESAATATITVTRTAHAFGPVSIDCRTLTTGTATADSDYASTRSTLIFLDGETTKTFTVPIVNDSTDEPDETIQVVLEKPTLGTGVIGSTTATITIVDDDVFTTTNAQPVVTIVSPTQDQTYEAHTALLSLSGTASDDGTIASVTWADDRGHSGTAQGTTDWLIPAIPLASGTTTVTVTVRDNLGAASQNTIAVTLGSLTYLLAEGATGSFFDLDILLANPNAAPSPITMTFLKEDGAAVMHSLTLPAMSRTTVRVDDLAGLENASMSTVVTTSVATPLVVERTMRWDGVVNYGAHTDKAVDGAARTWYFAEGSQGFFSTYVLLANPNPTQNEATITYLRENAPPVVRTYPLNPSSRRTIDAGEDAELVNQSFGLVVTFAQPGVAERAMYFGLDPLWMAGHESAGVTSLSTTWFLAEGATGPFFDTFVLLSNPQTTAAEVQVTYLLSAGNPVTQTVTVPASGRLTINVEQADPALANAAVATQLSSSVPIVVERAQYWPFTFDRWHEAHNSFGVTALGTSWGLAEGRTGAPDGGSTHYQTYVLLANPGPTAADVTLTFLRANGTTLTKTVTVPAASRFNVATGADGLVPELVNEEFATVIASSQPIAVERALYLDAGGVTWTAGTNATATRLP